MKLITVKDEVRLLHSLLKNRSRWYIDMHCDEDSPFYDIAEDVKGDIDDRISNMSISALYEAYLQWEKSDRRINPAEDDQYKSFLDDLCWDIGYRTLQGRKDALYEDSMIVTFEFI